MQNLETYNKLLGTLKSEILNLDKAVAVFHNYFAKNQRMSRNKIGAASKIGRDVIRHCRSIRDLADEASEILPSPNKLRYEEMEMLPFLFGGMNYLFYIRNSMENTIAGVKETLSRAIYLVRNQELNKHIISRDSSVYSCFSSLALSAIFMINLNMAWSIWVFTLLAGSGAVLFLWFGIKEFIKLRALNKKIKFNNKKVKKLEARLGVDS